MANDAAREIERKIENKDDQQIIDLLTESTWEGTWDTVVAIYRKFPWTHIQKINDSSKETALHAAADSGGEDIVEKLVKIILNHHETESQGQVTEEQAESIQQQRQSLDVGGHEKFQQKEVTALKIQNENGDTPLHLAASKGFVKICVCIVGMEPHHPASNTESIARARLYLLRIKNKQGETPLFLAALNWHKQTFVYLNDISGGFVLPDELRRNDGDTILHCAIRRERFDLANIIINYYGFLSFTINTAGFTPLALLATRPAAFRSSTFFSWWQQILYYCIPVKPLDIEVSINRKRIPRDSETTKKFPDNYQTCCDITSLLSPLVRSLKKMMGRNKPEDTEDPIAEIGDLPANYATWLDLVTLLYVNVLGLSGVAIKIIKKRKKKHLRSLQLLAELMKEPSQSYRGVEASDQAFQSYRGEASFQMPTKFPKASEKDDKATPPIHPENTKGYEDASKSLEIAECQIAPETEKKETALLLAARNGIVEIVNEILKQLPVTIQEKNWEKKNVLLVAVQNRQPLIVKALRRHTLWSNLILGVDEEDNTVLHLAAKMKDQGKPWKIAGVAMQMIWDIKWYEYIKSLVPQHFHFRTNTSEKTPGEIFNETHEALVSQGSEWLKDTSESCSLVAALIAGVSFATSSTVPGGNNSDTGKPALAGQLAFDLFAMTSLVSLCFSVTALIMFLSILTSRKQATDFRRDLPFKLLLGLSSLFVSIASMFISFCAGHFFVVRDKFKNTIFPIYAATCLPVSFFAVAQFPLYIDLLTAIVGKVPHPRNKGGNL